MGVTVPKWSDAWGLWSGKGWYGAEIAGKTGVLVFAWYPDALAAAREIEKNEGIKLWPERVMKESKQDNFQSANRGEGER